MRLLPPPKRACAGGTACASARQRKRYRTSETGSERACALGATDVASMGRLLSEGVGRAPGVLPPAGALVPVDGSSVAALQKKAKVLHISVVGLAVDGRGPHPSARVGHVRSFPRHTA